MFEVHTALSGMHSHSPRMAHVPRPPPRRSWSEMLPFGVVAGTTVAARRKCGSLRRAVASRRHPSVSSIDTWPACIPVPFHKNGRCTHCRLYVGVRIQHTTAGSLHKTPGNDSHNFQHPSGAHKKRFHARSPAGCQHVSHKTQQEKKPGPQVGPPRNSCREP
jgi:hypothetical protein